MVKRYYIQDYPEYSGSSDGLGMASEVMSGTFRSVTQSNNARSRRKGSSTLHTVVTDDRKG